MTARAGATTRPENAGQKALSAVSSRSGFLEPIISGELWLRIGELLAGPSSSSLA